jgi:hypothetical protein
MFNHPRRVYRVLVPAAVIAFVVSAMGHGTPSTGGVRYWIGAIGWASFGVLFVATVLYSVALGLRTLIRRRTPSTIDGADRFGDVIKGAAGPGQPGSGVPAAHDGARGDGPSGCGAPPGPHQSGN